MENNLRKDIATVRDGLREIECNSHRLKLLLGGIEQKCKKLRKELKEDAKNTDC